MSTARASEPLLATKAQRLFVLTITLQAIAVLTLIASAFRLIDEQIDLSSTPLYRTVPCYLALFALGEVFELTMAFDALRLRNIIQLFGILFFHCALIIMAALQIEQTEAALDYCNDSRGLAPCDDHGPLWVKVKPILITVPCVIGASWLLMLFFVKQLYEEFGWTVFRVVGANPKMKTMYRFYQVMICLLKFDFFFFIGVTMQLIIIVLSHDSAEFAVTIVAIPVVLVLLFGCGWAVSREVKWLMTASFFLMLAAMSYFLYKLVRFFQPSQAFRYDTTRKTLTVFTVTAFVLLLTTFIIGLRCFSDFDRGLASSKINDSPWRPKLGHVYSTGSVSEKQSSYKDGKPLAQRISIE